MTLADRLDAYRAAYGKWPSGVPWIAHETADEELQLRDEKGAPVLYGVWVIGQDYTNRSPLYGSYPHGYLDRVMALFPDVVAETATTAPTPDAAWPVLHACSGGLPPGPYVRLDLRAEPSPGVFPDYVGSIYDIGYLRGGSINYPYRLVCVDPPYSQGDAEKYGTPMVDRRRAMNALSYVTEPGSFVAWLDTCWPQFSKTQWRTAGRILVVRSTNHRVRVLSLFERI